MTVVDRVAWVVIDGQRYVHWDDLMEFRWWCSLTAQEQAALSQDTEEAHELGMATRDRWARSIPRSAVVEFVEAGMVEPVKVRWRAGRVVA